MARADSPEAVQQFFCFPSPRGEGCADFESYGARAGAEKEASLGGAEKPRLAS